MPVPVFTSGEILTAANMNQVGLWRIADCTVSSAGGTAATASNGVITVGTGNTSVTINGAFSTDHDNYRVILSGVTWSAADTTVQVQPGGVATANYYGGGFFQLFGAGLTSFNLNAGTAGAIGITSTTANSLTADILGPFLSQRTYMIGSLMVGTNYAANYSSMLATTASYTSVTFSGASGTMTGGKIFVYGYNK